MSIRINRYCITIEVASHIRRSMARKCLEIRAQIRNKTESLSMIKYVFGKYVLDYRNESRFVVMLTKHQRFRF